MNIQEVYLISQGAYSDYRIVAVTPSKEVAEAIDELARGSDQYDAVRGESEDTVPLLTEVPPHQVVWEATWRVDAGGELHQRYNVGPGEPHVRQHVLWNLETPPYHLPQEKIGPRPIVDLVVDRTLSESYPGRYLPEVRLSVWGTEREAVVKVCSDRRAAMLANYVPGQPEALLAQ